MSLDLTVYQLVRSNLPADFVVSDPYIDTRLKYWQLFLYRAAKVAEEDKYDIDSWTDEWRVLLSHTITYDIYLRIITGSFIAQISGGDSEESGSGQGPIKKIATGPTEVEYHNTAGTLSSFLKGFNAPGGMMELFMQEACGWAAQLGVKLPFCSTRNLYKGLVVGKRPLRGKRYYNYLIKKVYGQAHKPSSMG